jgi:hypothetical protein
MSDLLKCCWHTFFGCRRPSSDSAPKISVGLEDEESRVGEETRWEVSAASVVVERDSGEAWDSGGGGREDGGRLEAMEAAKGMRSGDGWAV